MEELGSINVETCACPLCGRGEFALVLSGTDRLHGMPGTFGVGRCVGCGLMRTTPRPTAESLGTYYPESYSPFRIPARKGPVARFLRSALPSLDSAIPDLSPGLALELGPGSGAFLWEMRERGWRIVGVEPDLAAAASAARATGATVLCGHAEGVSFRDETFDLVCGWMAFEHMSDPVEVLGSCHRWLKPGGWLALSVPDAGSWLFRTFRQDWYALQLPTHLFHFTSTTLAAALLEAGFRDVRIRWQRTLVDLPLSLALRAERTAPGPASRLARRWAEGLPGRVAGRILGVPAGALRLSGRMTAWARRPE